jgi:copper homeostasis protein
MIDLFVEHGADGIAFGLLTDAGEVDVARCRQIVRQIGVRAAVFHRAFDVTPDPFCAMVQLIECGIQRVMTSGQAPTAVQGAGLITELIRRARGRIEVLSAAGINPSTVIEIVARTGCNQVHASLRGERRDRSVSQRPEISFGRPLPLPADCYEATDATAVKELSAMLRNRSVAP